MGAPRIVFAGTPAFAVPSLQALLDSAHAPVAVYTQPDRPAGRGRQLRPSPVKICAAAAGIPVCQPQTLRDAAAQEQLAAWEADLILVAAYGLILPPAVLALPRLGCVNVHASLLPRWRGAAPIQRALLAGDTQSGICLMQMEAGLDTGPILAQSILPIQPGMNGGELHDALAQLGAQLLRSQLAQLLAGTLKAQEQNAALATYASKITKEDLVLDWQRPAAVLERQVLAFHPAPIAHTYLDGQSLRIWRAQAQDTMSDAAPGTVYRADATGIYVATGAATLCLTEVQLPGGKPLSIKAFLNSRHLLGKRLGCQ